MYSKELVGASTVPIILSILSEGENYGYAIIKEVKEASLGKLEWSEPMLYPVLHRLDNQGLITSSWKILENGRKRKYYAITPSGLKVLSEKKEEWLDLITYMSQLWNLKPTNQ